MYAENSQQRTIALPANFGITLIAEVWLPVSSFNQVQQLNKALEIIIRNSIYKNSQKERMMLYNNMKRKGKTLKSAVQ